MTQAAQDWVVWVDEQPLTVLEGLDACEVLARAMARVDERDHAGRVTRLVEVAIMCEESGEGGRAFVEVAPVAPACVRDAGHRWRSVVLGGVGEDAACLHCGCLRSVDGARGPLGGTYVRTSYYAAEV